jgi:hypothetical protein
MWRNWTSRIQRCLSVQKNPGAAGSVRPGEIRSARSRSHEIVDYVIAVTDIRLSDGGTKLRPEAVRLIGLLVSMHSDLQTPPDFQFYVQRNGVTEFPSYSEPRSIVQLQHDLNKAHDNLKRQVRINTTINKKLTNAENALRWEIIWRRILTSAIAVAFALIGWLAAELLHRI